MRCDWKLRIISKWTFEFGFSSLYTVPKRINICAWEMLIFTCINGQNMSPVWKERQTESTQIICRLAKYSGVNLYWHSISCVLTWAHANCHNMSQLTLQWRALEDPSEENMLWPARLCSYSPYMCSGIFLSSLPRCPLCPPRGWHLGDQQDKWQFTLWLSAGKWFDL